jgi:hypothetical protein
MANARHVDVVTVAGSLVVVNLILLLPSVCGPPSPRPPPPRRAYDTCAQFDAM